ncbi:MAG: hypothetical protein ACLUDQ_01285, partial [Bilophila wadsworthia]
YYYTLFLVKNQPFVVTEPFEKTQRIIYDIQQLDISRLCCFCAILGAIISGIMNIIVLYLFL